MRFEDHGNFRKDVRGLLKRFKSLDEDLVVVRKVLTAMPDERPPISFRMTHHRADAQVINIRMACKSLKGQGVSSGLRLIYALFRQEKRIVMMGLFHIGDSQSREKKILGRKF